MTPRELPLYQPEHIPFEKKITLLNRLQGRARVASWAFPSGPTEIGLNPEGWFLRKQLARKSWLYCETSQVGMVNSD